MDKVKLNFSFDYWTTVIRASGPNPDYSQAEMKKHITDSIKNAICNGIHYDYEKEYPLFLTIPYFEPKTFKCPSSIKVSFNSKHKFTWHVITDNQNDTEISYDYPISVEVAYKCD